MQVPSFLNVKQACAELGVSERKFHQLRAEAWFPPAVEFGARCLKWPRDELIEAAKRLAPRKTEREEPPNLAAARAERATA